MSEETEYVELVKRATDGDVEAYGQLYRIYIDRIYRYVFYRVRDNMTAEDITEEVFVRAWKTIKSCRGRERTFRPWLYRIAHNLLVDVVRRTNRETPLEMAENCRADNLERDAEAVIERQKVLAAIDTLSAPQREVILLKFIEGADNEEIEQITGKRQGAIRALQMRALMTLRKRFSGVDGNEG